MKLYKKLYKFCVKEDGGEFNFILMDQREIFLLESLNLKVGLVSPYTKTQ
jgi:hypothetical protein